MPGSSRSFSRALSGVFQSWDEAQNWETGPTSEIKALNDEIYAYTKRHNTISTMTGTINEELRATHDEHIKNSGDIRKEIFFLDLLSRLSSMLSRKEVEMWLRTYLRPAIDSAGFDLTFVAKARLFISSLTMEITLTDDLLLLEQRNSIALMIMRHIATIFVGRDNTAYDIMGVSVSEAEAETQIHAERVRFIEKNAAEILRLWGLKYPDKFFTLLHEFYETPQKRFKVLDLASRAVSSNVSQIQKVLDTPFFSDLLSSLLLDESETILGCALGTLLMVIGKICHRVSAYLPELFLIFARLITWNSADTHHMRHEDHSKWNVAKSDQNAPIMHTQIFSDGDFNLSYLVTLLYGLFPSNLLLFCNSPKEYTQKHPTSFLSANTEGIRERMNTNANMFQVISTKSAPLLSRLSLHPNISGGISLTEELRDPIRWILTKNIGQDVGEEQVLLECFALNSDIIFDIPESFTLPESLLEKIQSASSLSSEASELGILKRIPSALSSAHSNASSHRGSLQSSNDVRVVLKSAIESSPWLNGERRVSIIPSNLILDTHAPSQSDTQVQVPDKITFKTVNFDRAKSVDSDLTVTESKAPDTKRKDHLSDLYTVHKKLFTTSAAVLPNSTAANPHTAQGTAGNFQGSQNTASGMLSKQLNNEGKVEEGKEMRDTKQSSSGTALDFYQRELLLMKNELEFSSYMKHLNKTKYIKLKIKHNQMIKDMAAQGHDKKDKTTHSANYQMLVDSMKDLQVSHNDRLARTMAENDALALQVKSLQEKVDKLTLTNEKSEITLISSEQAMLLLKAAEEEKDENVRSLQLKVHQLEEKKSESSSHKEDKMKQKLSVPKIFLSEEEKKISAVDVELEILKGENATLAAKLEKAVAEIELQKRSFQNQAENDKTESYVLFSNQAKNYERRIKEINDIKLKYEYVLSEQSAKIAHLSKVARSGMQSPDQSPYPNGGSQNNSSRDSGYDYFGSSKANVAHKEARGSLVSSDSFPSSIQGANKDEMHHAVSKSDSSRPGSASVVPIIKGRGGYQKRSKKLM